MSPGELIRKRRKELGYTQVTLAEAIGDITDVAVGHWERGLNLPNGSNLIKLCKLLGLKAEQITEMESESNPSEIKIMTDAFLAAPPEIRAAALRVLGVLERSDK